MTLSVYRIFFWKHLKRLKKTWKSLMNGFIVTFLIQVYLFWDLHRSFKIKEIQDYNNEKDVGVVTYSNNAPIPFKYVYTNSIGNSDYELLEKIVENAPQNLRPIQTTHEHIRDNNNSVVITFAKKMPGHLSYVLNTSKSFHFEVNFYTQKIIVYSINLITAVKMETYNKLAETQWSIDMEFIRQKGSLSDEMIPEMTLKQSPMLNIIGHTMHRSQVNVGIFLFVISFLIIPPSLIIYPIVEEKQNGIKELLCIATHRSYLNELALFTVNFLVLSVNVLCTSIGMYFGGMFTFVNPVIFIILMLLFLTSIIAYSFFLSTMFDTVTFVWIGSFLLYFVPILLFDIIFELPTASFVALFSPCSMLKKAMFQLSQAIAMQEHVTFADIFGNWPKYIIFLVYYRLVISTIIYFFFYYYISNVFPGRQGTPKPFYFMFMRSYWCRKRDSHVGASVVSNSFADLTQDDNKPGVLVFVTKLTKMFNKNSSPAVNKIDFELPKNRVTVLLGHNGAGKTTTMQMITGIVPLTSGTICVGGEDNVANYRSIIGYCPQNDVFISYLNCRDHLVLFGCLRGLSVSESNIEADSILYQVKLLEWALKPAHVLSSGLKRRLCLACAVIGQTKLVILDEPSTGLDPESRRALWDVIIKLRKTRTILLTTHLMEEADVLGDKIIIMDHGNIVCEGSQFDLKRKYGHGYTLHILKTKDFKYDTTISNIKKFVPEAEVKSNICPNVRIMLPYESMSQFQTMLTYLETNRTDLGINSISMAHTTMEDVFINSALIDNPTNEEKTADIVEIIDDKTERFLERAEPHQDVSKDIGKMQIVASLWKKKIFLQRYWKNYLCHIIGVSVFCLSIHMFCEKFQGEAKTFQELPISATNIRNPQLLLAVNSSAPDFDEIINSFDLIAKEEKFEIVLLTDHSLFYYLSKTQTQFNKTLLGGLEISVSENATTPERLKIQAFYQGVIPYSQIYVTHVASNFILKHYVDANYSMDVAVLGQGVFFYDALLIPVPNHDMQGEFFETLFPLCFVCYIMFYLQQPYYEESSEVTAIQRPIFKSKFYWLASYLADCLCHTIVCFVFMGLILIRMLRMSSVDKTWIPNILSEIFMLISFTGYVFILRFYILTKFLKKLSSICSYAFYSAFLGAIVSGFYTSKTVNYSNFWIELLRFSPDFTLQYEFSRIFKERFQFALYIRNFTVQLILGTLIIYLRSGDLYISEFLTRVAIRYNPKTFFMKNLCSPRRQGHVRKDTHIRLERQKIASCINEENQDQYAVLVSKLKKIYRDIKSVRNVSFTVDRGHCFGLVGVNGAGKSSIFRMIALNTSVTDGVIYLNGHHHYNDLQGYQRQFGYCPEKHALLDFFNVREMVKYVAWIRGTNYSQLDAEANRWMKTIGLEECGSTLISDLSGGTKRKLNTIVSMMGDPSILMLDEPTSGVDPISKLLIWSCIKQFHTDSHTVIMSSQSMNELDELCNRIAVLNSGKLQYIGYLHEIKSVYGDGFTLLIKLREHTTYRTSQMIITEVQKLYYCEVRDNYAAIIIFHVIDKNIKWSTVFNKIQEFCKLYEEFIEDFAINEMTLEDIFLRFSMLDDRM